MKIASFLLPHVLRPSTTKQGKVSELVQQLRKIYNHQRAFPAPKKPDNIEIDLSQLDYNPLKTNKIKLENTKEYKQLVSDARQQVWNEFAKKERENAYTIQQSYTANGGMFSYAQQLANKSGSNIIGVKGEYIGSSDGDKQQYLLFRPQTKLLEIVSNLGNYFLSKWQ
ncbi:MULTISPECIES: hypothetical protein [Providencia]|jgi:hypothetical protein|uniref:hypothetical protein n=1 Tax=Providencia TaxID=586 RepID=UPI001C5AEB63|nr:MULTISPECIES: hypothetical protein [Providencia]ELR5150092.1 hypothetical protein [Providencia rettgeri]QXX81621.1 hypothetical protein J6836_15365 [Providencia sp. R33]